MIETLAEIWWQGRQWAVTADGLESLDGRGDRLTADALNGWIADDFATAYRIAIAMHSRRLAWAHRVLGPPLAGAAGAPCPGPSADQSTRRLTRAFADSGPRDFGKLDAAIEPSWIESDSAIVPICTNSPSSRHGRPVST
jgi:hypothetical protein